MAKGLTNNIKFTGSKPHVILCKILFFRVCDMAMGDIAIT